MQVTTYFLHMFEAPGAPRPLPEGARLHKPTIIPLAEYRRLYAAIGEPWLWYERTHLDDGKLRSLVHAANVHIYTLLVDDQVAGFAELHRKEDEVQLMYFGLLPSHIGLGFGRPFLDHIVQTSFALGAPRLWVHTCTLDHPRALATYQGAGFELYRTESGRVRIPADALERQRARAASTD